MRPSSALGSRDLRRLPSIRRSHVRFQNQLNRLGASLHTWIKGGTATKTART